MSGLQDEFDGTFKGKRFTVVECPRVISVGDIYFVEDTFEEVERISFEGDWYKAEEFCIFLNDLYDNPMNLINLLLDKYNEDESKCDVLWELESLLKM